MTAPAGEEALGSGLAAEGGSPASAGFADLAAVLAAARARAARGLEEGLGGITIAHQLTDDLDVVIKRLVRERLEEAGYGSDRGQAEPDGGPPTRVAVLATGGYGRREFAPFSDLDLVFLFDREPDERGQKLAERILHPLWDARVDAGHAVRSLREALELPESDLTAATALLDARFLAGDEVMAAEFLTLFHDKVAGARPGSFVARLQEEQARRHSRFGDTIFLLEPDLKNGPGGVRDMCAGRWAASARFGSGEPFRLREMGQMSTRQATAFETARDFLLKVRINLHLEAGRRQDQLRFDLQERIAPRLYREVIMDSADVRSEVAPAVEALMHDFQRHARTISRETTRLLLHAAADPTRQPAERRLPGIGGGVDRHFVERDGALEVIDPGIFRSKPSEMFRLFEVAIDRNLPVGLRTTDVIAELSASAAEMLRRDPDSAPRFLSVLTDVRDAATPSRLEQMNDLGLLAALLPEWEAITGKVQHDVYHVYTVDQHSLYAVALLKALARREHQRAHPWPTEEMRLHQRPVPLFVTALIHDIGKGGGKNHSAKGAVMGETIATRLGLGQDDVRRVEFLIREHLTMAHTSQRRDLDDPELVAHFASLCGDEETLRELFLLTFADLYCVGPGNLTTWKDELLRDLFQRARVFLRRGPDLLTAARSQTARRRRREVARKLRLAPEDPALAPILGGLPDRYFSENSALQVASHLQVLLGRKGACALEAVPQRGRDYVELVVVADDVPGLLAKITGVLFSNKLDIMDAAIYSRQPWGENTTGEALDIFRVRPATAGARVDEARIAGIRRDLEAVLAGTVAVESLVSSRVASAGSMFARSKPEVPPTEVKIDNEISRDFTVIDVFTEDRPGVLYTIAHVLFEQGLDIHRSKVGVEADRVADIFYVRSDATSGKIVDDERVAAIREALISALPGSRRDTRDRAAIG
jgi:[protein-PII] uridylyltransferase